MPGFNWNNNQPSAGDGEAELRAYPAKFSLTLKDKNPDGSPGSEVGTLPAGKFWIYTDVPGDNVFKLDSAFQLNAEGVGGLLVEKKDYNFYFSLPGARLEKAKLESTLKEADCQKVNTGSVSTLGRQLEVALTAKVVKIKLGKKAKTAVAAGEVAKLWIPTAQGGRVSLKHSVASAEVSVHKTLGTVYQSPQRDAKAVVGSTTAPASGKESLSFDVKKGDFGWFFIFVSQPGELTASLYTECVPRLKDKSPFFPDHFFYWPVNKTDAWTGEASVFQRYGKDFGQEDAWRWEVGGDMAVKDAREKGDAFMLEQAKNKVYERADHGHYRPSQPGWAGHCHNSAPASMVFEITKPFIDLKSTHQLTAEIWGNYGSFKVGMWSPSQMDVILPLKWTQGSRSGVSHREENLIDYIKPSQTDPAAALAKAIHDKHHWREEYNGEIFEMCTEANAKEIVDKIVADFGGAEAFKEAVRKHWRVTGPSFLAELQSRVGDGAEPCMGDIRANQAEDGPSAIWNNCIMYVRNEFAQKEGQDDEKLVTLESQIFFNIDNANVIGRPTCVVEKGEIVPKEYWARKMLMHVQYTPAGAMDLASANNDFYSFTAFGNNWTEGEVYMVSYLSRPKGLSSSRLLRDDFGGGNPYVDKAMIDQGYLKVRDIYAA